MLECFREVVAVDFEFIAAAGNRPVPICFVAHELRSERRFRVWRDQFAPTPPYATGTDVLFVLRIGRAWLLSRARLVDAGTHYGLVHRIQG